MKEKTGQSMVRIEEGEMRGREEEQTRRLENDGIGRISFNEPYY